MTKKTKAKSDAAATTDVIAPKTSKLEQMTSLLRRPEGATIEAMMAATGWQAHSVRGAMSGSLKKKAGLAIVSEKTDGVRVYRLANEAAA